MELCEPRWDKCIYMPVNCSDGNACTTDGCDRERGCWHAAIDNCCTDATQCDDGDECTYDICIDNMCCHVMHKIPSCMARKRTAEDVLGVPPACGDGSVNGDEECDYRSPHRRVGWWKCSKRCTWKRDQWLVILAMCLALLLCCLASLCVVLAGRRQYIRR